MCMAIKIRRFIFSLEEGQLFSSRQLLVYGNRSVVDQNIYRMVKRGVIVRIARGIFMRETADSWRPSIEQVAEMKAQTFGKLIASSKNFQADADIKPLVCTEENSETFFCSSGGTSSFQYGGKRIVFKNISLRKLLKATESSTVQSLSLIDFHPGNDINMNGESQKAQIDYESFSTPELVFKKNYSSAVSEALALASSCLGGS